MRTPAGRKSRKPSVHRSACAIMRFVRVLSPPPPPPPLIGAEELELGAEESGLVRSSTKVPESRCWMRFADGAGEPGGVVPKAHMTCCCVSVFACARGVSLVLLTWAGTRTGMVYVNFGVVPFVCFQGDNGHEGLC